MKESMFSRYGNRIYRVTLVGHADGADRPRHPALPRDADEKYGCLPQSRWHGGCARAFDVLPLDHADLGFVEIDILPVH